jgi:hypothetical protein
MAQYDHPLSKGVKTFEMEAHEQVSWWPSNYMQIILSLKRQKIGGKKYGAFLTILHSKF